MNKKIIKALPLLAVTVAIFLFIRFYNTKIDNELNENPFYSVARVTAVEYGAKNVSASYIYYYDNKVYRSSAPLKWQDNLRLENRYFKVQLSTKNPEINEILFDVEILDTLEIEKAGFLLSENSNTN